MSPASTGRPSCSSTAQPSGSRRFRARRQWSPDASTAPWRQSPQACPCSPSPPASACENSRRPPACPPSPWTTQNSPTPSRPSTRPPGPPWPRTPAKPSPNLAALTDSQPDQPAATAAQALLAEARGALTATDPAAAALHDHGLLLRHGRAEGRAYRLRPLPHDFRPATYRLLNPDLAAANDDYCRLHFAAYGADEARPWRNDRDALSAKT